MCYCEDTYVKRDHDTMESVCGLSMVTTEHEELDRLEQCLPSQGLSWSLTALG